MALATHSSRSAFLAGTRPTGLLPRVAAAVRPAVIARQQVKAQALFGFGANKKTTQYYICIDCGYIYPDGDIKKAPGSYKCPVCSSPKSRFKVYKGTDVKGKPNNTGAALKKRFQARQW